MGDSVLERNLCFVDTPGYGNKTSVSVIPFWIWTWLICAVSGIYHTCHRLHRVPSTESRIYARLK